MSNTGLSIQQRQSTQRPATLIERIREDSKLFRVHINRDFSAFLVDEKGKKLPKDIIFEAFVITWFEHLPVYTNEHFASCVMRHFSDASAVEVAPAIDNWFPNADLIDVEYLDNILDEVEGRVIDLQDNFTIDNGIAGYVYDTLNLIIYPSNRLTRNISAARKVLKSKRKLLRQQEFGYNSTSDGNQRVSYIARLPAVLEPNNSPIKEAEPALQWRGSVAELAALIVELAEKGYINLPGQTNSYGPTWEKVCRSITSLFELTTRRETSKGEAWETLATYFKTKELEFKTRRTVYPKLESSRAKFSQIEARTLALSGP
jgi:hypothetical protein